MRRIIGIVVMTIVLISCGPSKPDFDEKAALDSVNFSDPIIVSIPIGGTFDQTGGVISGANSAIFALLWKAGLVSIISAPSHPPYWNFYAGAATINYGQLSVPIARRVVTGHSDERRWEQEGTELYAETINYTIELNPSVRVGSVPSVPPQGFRLVIANDPSVGKWQVVGGRSTYTGNDAGDVTQALSSAGSQFVGELEQTIRAAIQKSFVAIEQRVEREDGLSRVKGEPFVLRSQKSGLLYYTKFNSFPSISFDQAKSYCANVSALGKHSWYVASAAELEAVVAGRLIDTPDHRFWGALGTPTDTGNIYDEDDFITSSFFNGQVSSGQNPGDYYSFYTAPDIAAYPSAVIYELHRKADGDWMVRNWFNYGTWSPNVSVSAMSHFVFSLAYGRNGFRVICVAH